MLWSRLQDSASNGTWANNQKVLEGHHHSKLLRRIIGILPYSLTWLSSSSFHHLVLSSWRRTRKIPKHEAGHTDSKSWGRQAVGMDQRLCDISSCIRKKLDADKSTARVSSRHFFVFLACVELDTCRNNNWLLPPQQLFAANNGSNVEPHTRLSWISKGAFSQRKKWMKLRVAFLFAARPPLFCPEISNTH